MIKVALALLLATVLLTACGKSSMDHGSMKAPEQGHQMGNAAESQQADDVKATFKLSTEMPQPNQDTAIKIDFQDKQGKAIEKYDINHEKQLHLITTFIRNISVTANLW